MKVNDYFTEKAEVPAPKCSGLISRRWKLKNGKKDELEGYESKFLCESFNIGLAFHKYVPDIRFPELSERKRLWLQELSKRWKFNENNLPNGHIYKHLKSSNNIDAVEQQLRKRLQMEVEILDMKTAQPLIVGLGEPSPYETGITLDFLTGLPIIPGSAVKGITRRAAILKLAWKNRCQFGKEFKEKFGFELQSIENAEYADLFPYGDEFDFVAQKIENDLRPNKFVEVFGTQELKGQVIFIDAYPIRWSKGLFRVDVINPHYGPYYESKGGQPPADWYNPVPVPYLTVNTGVEYRFVLASKDEELLKKAVEWLKFALENIGVGAKGSQGYGVFKDVESE